LLKCDKNYEVIEISDSNRQRKACISDIKFSPHNSMLAAGSLDSAIDFFEITPLGKLSRVGYCTNVPGPVLQIDWSTSVEYIKVGTCNFRTAIYKVPKGNEIKDEEIHDKVEWNQWTR
jgi:WD40 repeat protein